MSSNPDGSPEPNLNAAIRHLRAFLSVAKHRSFTRAATALHISQPSLTMTIQQLEQIVGGALFDRTTRNVMLTPEGQDLHPVAERVVDDFDLAIRNIRLTAANRNSFIRVAVVSSIATKILPGILDNFLGTRSGMRIQIREGNSNDVRRFVRRNEVDVGFASKDGDDAELEFEALFQDQLGLIARYDHPLTKVARNGVVRWSDLDGHDFIGLTQDTATAPIMSQISDLPSNVTMPKYAVSTYPTLWALIENGLGVTTAPALAGEFMNDTRVLFFGLSEPNAWRSVYCVTRSGRMLSPMAALLVKQVREVILKISKNHRRIKVP